MRTLDRIYKIRDLVELFGVNKSTVWRWIKSGRLPEPTRLSKKSVFWPREAIDSIVTGSKQN